MGMRSAYAPVRPARARDARVMTLPPVREAAPYGMEDWARDDELDMWGDDAARLDTEQDDVFSTLLTPELEETLDFTDIVPVVRAAPRRPAVARHTYIPAPTYRPASMRLSPARPAALRPSPVRPGRVRQVTHRLAEIGAIRPVVRIPARAPRRAKHAAARPVTWQTKLPPVWLLANLVIVLAVGMAVLPRVLPADAASACTWHTVVPGDTLGNLGSAHHSTALAIARANSITNPDLIFVGQRICIPLTSAAHAASAPAVPHVSQPPNYGSARGVQQFIQYALPYARRAHEATGWPVSVILAQWGLEQGWKIPGYTGFNWGNVAALPGEPTVNGIAVPGSPAAFAYAHTPDDGLRYYVRVAHLSYYRTVGRAGNESGAEAAARALGASPWDAGHYTDSGNPGSSLVSIMRVYNLFWYDTH